MTLLAVRNLLHDRVRLAVTLTGIIFALVLIAVQFGLFLGFMETSSNIVQRSGVDLWVTAPGIPHVNGGSVQPERRRYQVLSVPGVAKAEPYLLAFANWKLPSGAKESVQVVGYDLDTGLGGPDAIVEGSPDALRADDTVVIDLHYRRKLGIARMGDAAEINGVRARVAGYTSGMLSFTTAPYIFTSFKHAQKYMNLDRAETIFIVVRLAPGADAAAVKRGIARAVPECEVFTNAELARKTQFYWVFSTGAGITTLMGAVLGLLVGTVVVAQTIYSATVDHLREFGTLKAMGAANRYIYRVIVEQAVLAAAMGYGLAIGIAYMVVRGARNGDALMKLPPEMALGLFGLAVVMCVAASLLSIRKATTIDPAMVFRG
jgi:putative ABC transport system permease protein